MEALESLLRERNIPFRARNRHIRYALCFKSNGTLINDCHGLGVSLTS